MFFDDHQRFLETSTTAASATRLNLRHEAIIETNRDILAGANVLDLASHDGRWSYAALEAGAAHVTGVEARPELVKRGKAVFAEYGMPSERYDFICGDMFEVLRKTAFDVDVVLCLGFVYHTLRYPELFRGIMDAAPRHLVIDTKVIQSDDAMVKLFVNRTGVQSHAAKDETSSRNRAIAGWPSLSALQLMLDVYGFEIEQQLDWKRLLSSAPDARPSVRDYATGNRVTIRCKSHT